MRAAQQSWQIIGKSIFRARNAGAGDEIEKSGGARGNFLQALVIGGRSGEKDSIEVLRAKDTTVVFRFFGSKVCGENTIGTGLRCGSCKFFQTHLQDGIEIAEKNQGNL